MYEKLKNKPVYLLLIISLVAIVIRGFFINYESGDYLMFLSQWCEHLEMKGGFKGILTVDADYNAVYLYFLALFTYLPFDYLYSIKALSIIFDFAMAGAAYLLVYKLMENSEKKVIYSLLAYGIILCLPTVVLNSSYWAQCDSIYTAFILLSLYFMFNKKYDISFILYGIAFTFKLQAIFLLPVYGIVYLKNKDFSIFKFAWVAVVNFVLFIPAVVIGKPITAVLDAYTMQVGKYSYKTVFGYPNIYNLLPVHAVQLNKIGIIFTMCLLMILMIIVLRTKGRINDRDIIGLSVAVILLVTYFLPEMHDRYAYVAEVLSIVYLIVERRNMVSVIIINVCATVIYMMCLYRFPENLIGIVSVIQFIPVFMFNKQFIQDRLNNKRETVN